MTHSDVSDTQAKDIYQGLLDQIAQAYMDQDFAAFETFVRVPHLVHSFGPTMQIKTRRDLQELFNSVCTYQITSRITDYHRICIAATFKAADEIEGVHETRLISGSQLLEAAYPVKSVLRQIDGKWWVCESDNALEPNKGLGKVFSQPSKMMEHRQ